MDIPVPSNRRSRSADQMRRTDKSLYGWIVRVKNKLSRTRTPSPSPQSHGSSNNQVAPIPIGPTPDVMAQTQSNVEHSEDGNNRSNIQIEQPKPMEVAKKVIGWILPVLKVVKEVGAVFPPLQGAVGGIVGVLEVFQVLCL